jgi:hypothetical protein
MAKPPLRSLRRTPLRLDHYVLSILLAVMAGLALIATVLVWPR